MRPGDAEWELVLTASQFGGAIGYAKAPSRAEVWRRSLGIAKPVEGPAIEHGVYYEPIARDFFTKRTGLVALPIKETITKGNFGVTPDGMILQDGLPLEIKCPYTLHAVQTTINPKYFPQLMGSMWLLDKPALYFTIFVVDFNTTPETYGITAWKVYRCDPYIEAMKSRLTFYYDEWFGKEEGPPRFKKGEKQEIVELFDSFDIHFEEVPLL